MRTKNLCCALAVPVGLSVALFASAAEPPPRAARSVHLAYLAAEASLFYNELTVEQSVPGSYFMACGFNHGYFGIQEQSQGKKVVIFSVWDPTRGNEARAVPEDQRVEILYRAKDVVARRFGGEGTGGQSFFDYDWKICATYRFFVKATIAEKKTAYAAYFFLPEEKTWKHLITFRTRTGGDRLKGLYSFIEDFRRDGQSRQGSPSGGFRQRLGVRCEKPVGAAEQGPLYRFGCDLGSEGDDRRRGHQGPVLPSNRRRDAHAHFLAERDGSSNDRPETTAGFCGLRRSSGDPGSPCFRLTVEWHQAPRGGPENSTLCRRRQTNG